VGTSISISRNSRRSSRQRIEEADKAVLSFWSKHWHMSTPQEQGVKAHEKHSAFNSHASRGRIVTLFRGGRQTVGQGQARWMRTRSRPYNHLLSGCGPSWIERSPRLPDPPIPRSDGVSRPHRNPGASGQTRHPDVAYCVSRHLEPK
jgi:hypothetical protein